MESIDTRFLTIRLDTVCVFQGLCFSFNGVPDLPVPIDDQPNLFVIISEVRHITGVQLTIIVIFLIGL